MQAQEPVTIHLSEKNGLPDKEFYNIFEDNKGFIWLCADKGFFRYDGVTYKNYSNDEQRGLSVFGVKQDHVGQIWCNNISGQFFYVKGDKLTLFIDLRKQLKGELADFLIDEEYLWLFTVANIYKVNLKTKEVKIIKKGSKHLGVPFRYNNTIYYQDKDSISSITSDNKIKNLVSTKLLNRTLEGVVIGQGKSNIFKLDTDLFLMQNRLNVNAFFQFDILKHNFKIIKGFEEAEREKITDIFENNNEVWLASESGVWVYEYMQNHFRLKKRFLKNENVTKILKDKDNNYWFTTLNSGIYIIPNINIEKCNISPINKNISSLDKINDSTLIFGLSKGNIGFYNTNNHRAKIIDLPTNDRVSALIYHPNKNIIISKDRSSYVLSYKTLKYSKHSEYLAMKSFSIVENDDLLYTNYNNVRLLKSSDFKVSKKDFFKKRKIVSDIKRTYTSFYDKNKKEVYISFVDDLVKYDSIWNTTIIQYKNKPVYGKSISETDNGIIWVATFKNGIFGIKNDSVRHHFTTENGLSSNNIERIKADNNTLWIALDNSIQVLDVITKDIKTLRKSDGVLSYDISGIEVLNNKIYFSSNEGLFSIDKHKSFKSNTSKLYFNKIEINERDTLINTSYTLKYDQNAIKVGFNVNGFIYNQKGKYKYRLKGFNSNWLITDIGENSVKYNSLPSGNYTFQVQPFIESTDDQPTIKELRIIINSPYWETWWFIWSISLLILGSTIMYFRNKMKNKEKERITQLEKLSLEKELIAINLTALRSQMNPHFIFNALNSIQDLVLKEDTEASYDYIVLFAELIRNALSYSNQDFISIDKELKFLKVYLQLEKLRFGSDFNYTISCNSNESIDIPSLLIQPFIENALVHGLLHKSGKKELNIEFMFVDNMLQCIITDNGIGRTKASEIANRQGNHHESFALGAIEKRLQIFKKQYNNDIGYVIEDLYDNDIAKGTKVTVTMPFNKRF